jgi:3-dehydroquinate dehydratase/shikimate dehydrogenase
MPTCVCLEGPTWADVKRQCRAALSVADLWELRVDLLDASAQQRLKQEVAELRDRPLVLTNRSESHGGSACDHPQDQIAMRRRLASLEPEYLDVEWPTSPQELKVLHALAPTTQIILSWHGEDLPRALHEELTVGDRLQPALWKIAPFCPDAASWVKWDAWWHQQRHLHGRLLFQPQGPLGLLQRLWGSRWQQPWIFSTSSLSLEGRVTPTEWREVYRMPQAWSKQDLGLYGVVGDPVAQSRGRLFHNRWMEAVQWPGRYVPIRCAADHWHLLWPWLRQHAAGLAITTPLKDVAVRSVDHLDPLAAAACSVNTLVRLKDGSGRAEWIGVNTDGPAAVAVMGGESHLRGKRVLVLGAGGVGRAVALACGRAGAHVTVCARRPDAAQAAVGHAVDVAAIAQWPTLARSQDWIVQATTCGFYSQDCPVDPGCLSGQSVLEIVQKDTPFLQAARARGCNAVQGVEMFVHLSKLQAELWTGGAICPKPTWLEMQQAMEACAWT